MYSRAIQYCALTFLAFASATMSERRLSRENLPAAMPEGIPYVRRSDNITIRDVPVFLLLVLTYAIVRLLNDELPGH
jgi:hypothetical protein